MATARDLRNWLLEAAYGNKVALALLFQTVFTPERLAAELSSFRSAVKSDIADRVHVLALDGPQQIRAALADHVEAHHLEVLTREIVAVSAGTVASSSRETVQLVMLRRWVQGLPPIRTADLAAESGASAPTVSAALKAIAVEVVRTRDRRVSLKGISTKCWQTWLGKSAEARTARFVYVSGSPRSIKYLAKHLMKLGRDDLAIGGVMAGLHHYTGLDITGVPRLDILLHGTHHADLSFMQKLDPGLECDDSAKYPRFVVHFTNRRESYFEAADGYVWACDLDCLVYMWHARLMHQVEDFVEFLGRRAKEV
jgi:hypothetical protein